MKTARVLLAALSIAIAVLLISSCGGGGGSAGAPTPNPVSVTVAPATASVTAGETLQFSASVTGSSNTAVSWSVNGTPGGNSTVGTITSVGLYTAPAAVPNPATVTVTATSQADATKSASAAVTVTPAPAPQASLSPASLAFGNETTGVASSVQKVTLADPGNAALAISGISITGTNAGDFSQTNTCEMSVAAGKNCNISATFKPSATGTRTASLAVSDDASGSPQSVALTGTGVAPPPVATVAPTSVDFGNEAVGVTSAGQNVTLTNSGQGTLDISGISITGTNAGDFSQSNVCGTSLAAGKACNIAVMFTPAASGTRQASLTVTDNASGSPQSVALTGTGVTPTVTGVTVSCSASIVQIGQMTQCQAKVTGTGSFSTTVTWTVDKGAVDSSGLFTAPSSQTTATVKATSTQDAKQFGTFAIVIAGRAVPTGSWQPSAPSGGRITVLASDPAFQTIFAGTWLYSGVWKSTDSGSSWKHILTSKDIFATPISDFWVSPGGQTVYALGLQKFFKSIDGGENWSEVTIFTGNVNTTPEAMAVDPLSNGSTIYVSATGRGIYKSSDGGRTWALLPSSPSISSGFPGALHNPLALDPLHEGTVFYGTDHGLYVSKDGGNTWSVSATQLQFGDTWFDSVAFDPLANDAIYLLASEPGLAVSDLYESTDGGATWKYLVNDLDSFEIYPDPNVATTLWLAGFVSHAVYKSTDGGHTFLPSDTGMQLLNDPNATVMTSAGGVILPLAGSSFLATDGAFGVYKSNDGGQSWSPSSNGISAYNGSCFAVDPGNPSTVYLGTFNIEGLHKSTDGGSTWTDILPYGRIHAIAVDPFHSGHILAADFSLGVIESQDGGTTWNKVTSLPSPPNGNQAFIVGITFDRTTQGTIYLSTTNGGAGVLKSTDDGVSYSLTGFTADTLSPVAVVPGNSNVLLVGTNNGLFKSTDGGATWAQTFSGSSVNSIAIDAKANPMVVYAGGGSLEWSADLGGSWTTIQNPPATTPVVVDPSTANSIFVLNNWSPDGGQTWVSLTSGVDALGSTAFMLNELGEAIAPTSPQTLFIVSYINGLWRFPIGP